MEYRILETRDFRGTFGLKHKDDIVEIENEELIKQLIGQGLIELLVPNIKINSRFDDKINLKEEEIE